MIKRCITMIAAGLALMSGPVSAQIKTVDPNAAVQADVTLQPGERGYQTTPTTPATATTPTTPAAPTTPTTPTTPVTTQSTTPPTPDTATASGNVANSPAATAASAGATYKRDDLIGAAEGVFGKGAAGLAGIIEKILKDQGEPNAYITGREVSLALGVGLRYGSGTLNHKVEGTRPVYWTGPSLGFDAGGDAAKVFVLVYNLYDTQDLYKRYPQVEGRAYFVGGLSATYLRRGSVVLIPVRLGVGVRLGANIGYMKFREKNSWLPF